MDEDYSYESIDSFLQSTCPKFYSWITSSGSTQTTDHHFYSITVASQENQVLLFKDGVFAAILCRIESNNTVAFLDDYDEIGQMLSSLSASDTINEVNQRFCKSVAIGLQTGSSISDFIYRGLSDISSVRDEIKVYIADISNYVDKYGVLNAIKILQGGLENFVKSVKYEDNQLSFTDNTGLIPSSWMSGVISGIVYSATQVISAILTIVNPVVAAFASLLGQGISYILNYFDPNSEQYVVSFNDNADHNCFHIAFYQYIIDIPEVTNGSFLSKIKELLLTEGPCVFDVPGGNLWITAYDATCSRACVEFHPILGINCCPPFSLKITPMSSSQHKPYTYYECVTNHNPTSSFTSVFNITYDDINKIYKFESHQISINVFEEIYNDVITGEAVDLKRSPNSVVFRQLYHACAWFTIWRYLYNGTLRDIALSPVEDYDGMSLNFTKSFGSATDFKNAVGIGSPGVPETTIVLNSAENVLFTLYRVVASKVPYVKYMPVNPFTVSTGDRTALIHIYNGNGDCPLCSNELAGLDIIVNMQDLCWKGNTGIYKESTAFTYSNAIIAMWSGFFGSYAGSSRDGSTYRYDVVAGRILMTYISLNLLDADDNIIPGGFMVLPKGNTFNVELPKYDFQSSIIQFIVLASVTLLTTVVASAKAFKIRKAVNLKATAKTAEIEKLRSKVVADPTNMSAAQNYNKAVKKWNLSYRRITGTKYNRYSYWGTSQGQTAGALPQPMIDKIGKLIDKNFA